MMTLSLFKWVTFIEGSPRDYVHVFGIQWGFIITDYTATLTVAIKGAQLNTRILDTMLYAEVSIIGTYSEHRL